MDFNKWVDSVDGAKKAADILDITPRLVKSWYYCARSPSLINAAKVVSGTCGAVDYNGLYGPIAAVMCPECSAADKSFSIQKTEEIK